MTPQEFRMRRILMGISNRDISRRFDVNMSTVTRWQKAYEAPEAIQEWMEEKWQLFLTRVTEGVQLVEDTEGGAPFLLYRDEILAQERQGMSVSEHEHLAAAIYMLCQMSEIPIWLQDVLAGGKPGANHPRFNPEYS